MPLDPLYPTKHTKKNNFLISNQMIFGSKFKINQKIRESPPRPIEPPFYERSGHKLSTEEWKPLSFDL